LRAFDLEQKDELEVNVIDFPFLTHHPEIAEVLYKLAESHVQQDSSFLNEVAFTHLTAEEALRQLHKQRFSDEQLPAPLF